MSQTVVLTDDITPGARDVETVRFGFEGTNYEIDLGKVNRREFMKLMEPLVQAARKVSQSSRRDSRTVARRREGAAARVWARENGWPNVADRGRIPAEAVAAYTAAH